MNALRQAMVVEDVALVAADLANIVTDLTTEAVLTAPTLARARQALDDSGIDLALLDVSLPDGDVFEIADTLLYRHIPYVFVTARNRAEIPVRHRGAPFVNKPFNESRIRIAILEAVADSVRREGRHRH